MGQTAELDQIIGPARRSDGVGDGPVRIARQGSDGITDAHGRLYEPVSRNQLFSLVLSTITTTVSAGNLVGAAAGAITQFALLNPQNSGKHLVLLKFGMGIISGTPGPGPLFHGFIPYVTSITAASPGGTVRNALTGNTGNSQTIPWALPAGAALTGGQAPVTYCIADFSATGTAQAIANGHVHAIENLDGSIIIPPGIGWLPLWNTAGTSTICSYSITWEEVPV